MLGPALTWVADHPKSEPTHSGSRSAGTAQVGLNTSAPAFEANEWGQSHLKWPPSANVEFGIAPSLPASYSAPFALDLRCFAITADFIGTFRNEHFVAMPKGECIYRSGSPFAT
jgi:hypothetical protein